MNDLEYVGEGNGIKTGFKIMVTIRSFADNAQAQVDFAIRESYHAPGLPGGTDCLDDPYDGRKLNYFFLLFISSLIAMAFR